MSVLFPRVQCHARINLKNWYSENNRKTFLFVTHLVLSTSITYLLVNSNEWDDLQISNDLNKQPINLLLVMNYRFVLTYRNKNLVFGGSNFACFIVNKNVSFCLVWKSWFPKLLLIIFLNAFWYWTELSSVYHLMSFWVEVESNKFSYWMPLNIFCKLLNGVFFCFSQKVILNQNWISILTYTAIFTVLICEILTWKITI